MVDTMSKQAHTKESIIQTLQNVAARLEKKALSKRDIQPHVPMSSVRYHFGSIGKALEAAGLEVPSRDFSALVKRKQLNDDQLFASVFDVEQKTGGEPTFADYRANGGPFSSKPFKARFGGWETTLAHYRKWKSDRGTAPTPSANRGVEAHKDNGQSPRAPASVPAHVPHGEIVARSRKAPQLFGEPINFRGLQHAPINEQGVVYLFGMVSRELGFSVESLQQGFPDCEGKYQYDKSRKLWAKARIEFEFRASNFREHCHDENGCDVIVCWENDWPGCPLRVVELRSEIERLSSK
jgi:hypothetical protein